MSPEVDVAPMSDADAQALSDQLSFDVGEGSEFHTEYGFYIEGVGKRTAILPPDWMYRLVGVRNEDTNFATGLCLEPHDLCAAKLMAHRDKDLSFVLALIEGGFIDPEVVADRVASIDVRTVESDQSLETLQYRQQTSAKWLAWASREAVPRARKSGEDS